MAANIKQSPAFISDPPHMCDTQINAWSLQYIKSSISAFFNSLLIFVDFFVIFALQFIFLYLLLILFFHASSAINSSSSIDPPIYSPQQYQHQPSNTCNSSSLGSISSHQYQVDHHHKMPIDLKQLLFPLGS